MCLNDTTKVCRKCGETKPVSEYHRQKKNPDGLQYWCKDCKRENTRQRTDYFAQRRIEKHDQIRAQQKQRYDTDLLFRERRKQEAKEYRQRPDAVRRERQRHYKRWADPHYRAQRVAKHRERRQRDPEYRRKVAHWRRARQARIRLQGKPFTHAEWVQLCEHYDHRCLCCGKQKPLSPDHVVPVSRGGSSDIENIQPLCVDCNKRKNARTIDYRPGWGD